MDRFTPSPSGQVGSAGQRGAKVGSLGEPVGNCWAATKTPIAVCVSRAVGKPVLAILALLSNQDVAVGVFWQKLTLDVISESN
jgi:hypothetical protein